MSLKFRCVTFSDLRAIIQKLVLKNAWKAIYIYNLVPVKMPYIVSNYASAI